MQAITRRCTVKTIAQEHWSSKRNMKWMELEGAAAVLPGWLNLIDVPLYLFNNRAKLCNRQRIIQIKRQLHECFSGFNPSIPSILKPYSCGMNGTCLEYQPSITGSDHPSVLSGHCISMMCVQCLEPAWELNTQQITIYFTLSEQRLYILSCAAMATHYWACLL